MLGRPSRSSVSSSILALWHRMKPAHTLHVLPVLVPKRLDQFLLFHRCPISDQRPEQTSAESNQPIRHQQTQPNGFNHSTCVKWMPHPSVWPRRDQSMILSRADADRDVTSDVMKPPDHKFRSEQERDDSDPPYHRQDSKRKPRHPIRIEKIGNHANAIGQVGQYNRTGQDNTFLSSAKDRGTSPCLPQVRKTDHGLDDRYDNQQDTEWVFVDVEFCDPALLLPADEAIAELTLDWYMQDDQENIWYVGEASRDFTDGCPSLLAVPIGGDLGDDEEECTGGSWEAGKIHFLDEDLVPAEAGIVVPNTAAEPCAGRTCARPIHYIGIAA